MRAQCFGALLRPLLGPGSRRGALPANRFLHTTRAVRQEASQTAPAEEQTWSESPLVAEGDDCLEVRWPDDTASSFHNIWLRDHCQCSKCRHEVTKQRLYDTYKIPSHIAPTRVDSTRDGITIEWNDEKDPHTSNFSWKWLEKNSYQPPRAHKTDDARNLPKRTLWYNTIATSPPTVPYEAVMKSDQGVLDWLKKIREFGFAFVEGCPPTPEATEELIRRISFIRETHYGGFWDFTADLAHGDTAYTNIELGSHTDTTYFSDPCGLQMFHLLSPPESHQGGKSVLVDGLQAAWAFKQVHPELYEVLSTLPVPTHASGGPDTLIRPVIQKPIFEEDMYGSLQVIRWNPDDRAVVGQGQAWQKEFLIKDGSVDAVTAFYEAIRKWADFLRSESSEYWFQLEAGKPLIFDNQRVLHGRSSFTGQRRMCGAYIPYDDYMSRLRTLTRKLEGKEWQ